jgi:predicted nucleic acid-binding protein
MIVVASPLHYLTLIGAVDVSQPLYGRVLVPQTVAGELQNTKTPAAVRAWITQPPPWCEIQVDPPADPALGFLDAGERAAITLALSIGADRLLIDDLAGRVEAERRQLPVTGTLGVLGDAHLASLLDFETALAQLRRTNFYISDVIVNGLRERLERAKGNA